MELQVIKRNGKLIYIIVDDKGVPREVTLDYVKFAIENNDLPEYFINDAGEVFLPTAVFSSCPKQYALIGRITTDKDVTYLLSRLMDKHTVRANLSTLQSLAKSGLVAGAIVNGRNELCTSIKLDEYTLKPINGKLIPVKITPAETKRFTTVEQPAHTITFTFASLIDQLSAFEKTITHTDTDVSDVKRKYPELYELSARGTVLQLDNNVHIVLDIVNLQDLISDIAQEAKLRLKVETEIVEISITDTDYRLSSIYFVLAAYEAYKTIFNKYAKLQSAVISNTDTNKSYWTIEFDINQKAETVKTNANIRTRVDVLALQEMYIVERSSDSIDMKESVEDRLLQGLKLGTSYFLINGAEQFISTSYKLSLVEKTINITLKNGSGTEISFAFKGKVVEKLDATKACLIAATGVANRQLITSVSIVNDSTNNIFTLQFNLKQAGMNDRRQNILSTLN